MPKAIKKIFIATFLLLGVLLAGRLLQAAMSSSNYQIWADSISEGGIEKASSTNYRMHVTVGESVTGRASTTDDDYSGRAGLREMERFHLSLSLSSGSLSLGDLNKGSTKNGSHTLTVETNSTSGVSVTYQGTTLTCSACDSPNTVSAIGGTAVASAAGTSQFGFNVILNTGSSASVPLAASVAPYNTSGVYAFNSGDQIISYAGYVNRSVFDVNYIANISGNERAGTYRTSITYTATANF